MDQRLLIKALNYLNNILRQNYRGLKKVDKSVMSITLIVSCPLRYIFPHWHKLQCPLLLKSAFIFKVGSHEVFKTKPRFTEPQNSQKL